MRITRSILEKKLEIFKNMCNGKFSDLTLDYYAIGGGYRLDNGNGSSICNVRQSASEMARSLDILINTLYIMQGE